MLHIQKFFNFSLLPYIVLFLVVIFLLFPLTEKGFFPMHDDTQVARVHQMAEALNDGMFPVRWVSDLGYGYGYPIFNFYAPLAYYVGAFFMFSGFDALSATKLMIALPLFFLGGGMYALASRFWGKAGGLISALLSVLAPYIAVNIFVRGAIAELYAISLIPLVFFALYQIHKTQKFRFGVLFAFSVACIVLSHNLTAFIFSPFLLIAVSVVGLSASRKVRLRVMLMISFSLLSALLLSAFYWLPAISEMKYTNVYSQVGGGADFKDHFVCPEQLWESVWGYGGSVAGCVDGMSFRLGKLHILLTLLVFPAILFIKEKRTRVVLSFGYVAAGISLFFLLEYSRFLWELIKPLEFVQYPWRFLGILSLSTSFICGGVVWYTRFINRKFISFVRCGFVLILLFLSIYLYAKLFTPQQTLQVTASEYTNLDTLHYKTSKISDEYLPPDFLKPQSLESVPRERLTLLSGDAVFRAYLVSTDEIKVKSSVFLDSIVRINTAYFPGWRVYLDGKEIFYSRDNRGLVVQIPKGEHHLFVQYQSTYTQNLANIASIIGILLLVTGIIFGYKRKAF